MITRRLGLAAFGLALLVAGCSSVRVNRAAQRESLSGEQDRARALKTLARLRLQTQDYRIGPSDVLEIGVFQWEMAEETKTISPRVSQQGTISLPLIGDLAVKGKTVQQVRVMIEEHLKKNKLINEPRVSVVIKEFRSKRVSVVGAVKDPGMYTLRENVTRLADILSLAGGLAETAGQLLYVIRTPESGVKKGEGIIKVDLHDLLVLGDLELNVVLGNGDLVHVPVAPKFFVYGYVRQPGAYDLKRATTVLEAIAIAGGLDEPLASPSACVLRSKGKEIPIDLVKIADGEADNYYLQADDLLEIRQTALRKVALVLWEGIRSIVHVGYSLNN